MEQVAYAEVGSQTVMTTSAPGQAQMPVSPGMTTAPAETVPSSPEVGETAARAGDETPKPEATETPMAPWEHYDEGIAAWKSGETTDAETHLREWVAYAPEHVKGRVNLARVLIEIGRPHEAKEHAKLAADLDPGSVAAKRVLARALAEGGDPHAALAMYEEALWLDPRRLLVPQQHGLPAHSCGGAHEEAVGPLGAGRAAGQQQRHVPFQPGLGARGRGVSGRGAAGLRPRPSPSIRGTPVPPPALPGCGSCWERTPSPRWTRVSSPTIIGRDSWECRNGRSPTPSSTPGGETEGLVSLPDPVARPSGS